MNKPNVMRFVKSAQSAVVKHSPEILTGIGIAGMITTTVLAVKATPKALILIEEKKEEERVEQLTPIETVKTAWKPYIPAVVTGTASIACLIGASSVHVRRNAALATAYKLSQTALTEYKEKVVETIGEKKEKVIREKIDKDHIDQNPVTKSEIIVTKKGSTLCFDYYNGRYFESDIEEVKKAINVLNGMLLREDYVSLNDLYDELGISHTPTGEVLGWNVDRVGRELIQPRLTPQMADDGRPCIAVSCDPDPAHGYSTYY